MEKIRDLVRELVLEDKYRINWAHIFERGHRITEQEIKLVLLHGRHERDKVQEDRFVAFGRPPPEYHNLRVVYTFLEGDGEMMLFIITAFVD
jgi:hypothetical protein